MSRDCADYREWISASLDRRLPEAETEELAAHLAGCPDCRRAHEEMDAGDALLRRMHRIELPAGFEDRVMATAATVRPLSRIRWAVPAALTAVAAALLVVLGLVLTVPNELPNRDLSENLSATIAVERAFASLTGKDPEKERAFARAEVDAFDLRRRTEQVKKEAAKRPELAHYVAVAEALQQFAEQGDVARLREDARQGKIADAARKIQIDLNVAIEPPKVAEIRFAHGTPRDVQCTVRGHVQLLRGNYDAAIRDLEAAVELQPACFLRAEAYRGKGDYSNALAEYTRACRASSGETWTRCYVARGLMDTARKVPVGVGTVDAGSSSEEVIAQALTLEGDAVYWVAGATEGSLVIVALEHNVTMQVLGALKNVDLRSHDGISTVRINMKQIQGAERVRLKAVEELKAAIEKLETPRTPQK